MIFFVFFNGCKKDEEVTTPIVVDPVETGIILNEPANNSTVNIFTVPLKWQQYLSSTVYHVQLSMDANFVTPLIIDTTVTAFETNTPPGRLTTNVYYYWRIQASLGSGNFSNWSGAFRFRVILAPPPPPILLLPPNNSTDQSFLPLFDWEDSPTAEFYRLQVSTSSSFSNIILDSGNIPVSVMQSPYFYFVTGTNYFWRVNATNSNGVSTGDWSPAFTFRTIDGNIPSSISGTIRFTDNNFVQPPFYYNIGAFKTNRWPPGSSDPDYRDSLTIQFVNNEYIANYTLRNVENGTYNLAVFTASRQLNFLYSYKSVYGCDTTRLQFSNCPLVSPGVVTISNGNGAGNINLLSWADSTKTIF
ncbi:MAG: hypothetical protein ABI543_08695 [Ignavibacteria bacterium]